MTAPDGHLSPLDRRFPIRLSMAASCFWETAQWHPDNGALPALAARARADEADHQERFVTPAPEPRFVPADTIVDMRRTDGDRFRPEDTLIVGEGQVRPGDTGKFLIVHHEAEAYEERAAQRRTWRRAWRWLRAT